MTEPRETAEGTTPAAATKVSRGRWARLLLMLIVVATVAATDLAVKSLLVPQLPPGGFTGGPIGLALSYNTGVGLSFGASLPGPVVVGLTAAIIAVIAALTARAAWGDVSRWRVVGLSLAVGGALGNLTDRAADGRVTDFIRLPWFTCNLADVAITVGIGIVLLTLLTARSAPVPQ